MCDGDGVVIMGSVTVQIYGTWSSLVITVTQGRDGVTQGKGWGNSGKGWSNSGEGME